MFRAVSVELDPAVSDRVPNIADRLEEFRTKYNIEVGKSQGKNYWVRGNLAQLQLVQEELESLQEDVEQVAKDTNDESNSRRHDSLDDQNLNTPISSNRAEEENEGLKKYDERTSLGHEHVQTQLTEDGSREEALNVIHTPNAINNVQDIEQPPHQIQEDDANISQSSCHQEQPEEKEDSFLDEIPSDDEPDIKHQSLSSDRLDDTNTSNQEKGGQSLDNGEIIIEAQGIVSSVNPDGVQSLVNEDKNKPSENGKLSKTESVKSGLGRHVDDVMLSSTQSDKSGLDPHVDDVMLSPTQSDSDDFLCPFDDDDDDDDNRQKEDGDLVNIEDEQPMTEIKNNSQGKSFLDTTVNNMPSEHSSILAEEDGLAPGSKPTDTSTDASTNAVDKIDSANQEEDNALTTVSNKEPDRSTPPIPPEPKKKKVPTATLR